MRSCSAYAFCDPVFVIRQTSCKPRLAASLFHGDGVPAARNPLRSAPAVKRGSAPLGRLYRLTGSVRRWKRLWALSCEKGAGGRQNRNVGTRPLRRAHIRRSGGADRGDSCRCFFGVRPCVRRGKGSHPPGGCKSGLSRPEQNRRTQAFFSQCPLAVPAGPPLAFGKKPETILQTDCCRAPRRSRPAP